MPAVPLPIAALAAASYVAPSLVAAIERALAQLGPVHAVVGHSLGGAMSMFSIAEAGGAGRVAAISAPSSLMRQLHRFAEAVGLSKRGKAAFIASVEAHVGRPASDFDDRRVVGKVDLPLLVVHDRNDRQVPVVEATRAAHALRGAELIVTQGLGHNRLLADPAVVKAVVDFVAGHAGSSPVLRGRQEGTHATTGSVSIR